ncbi:Uu.00g079640.m01.CDS01 [Anthostomella pinea]|uniref:Uu.00g079640.m01.CDS01 n=1 Tax=Anthostomella pinea TaxID=933095 RepID=A0AAI8VKX5_9PEZI|nr:Uu.00g079640.m01.CDS01 [Anthostomella pinea]
MPKIGEADFVVAQNQHGQPVCGSHLKELCEKCKFFSVFHPDNVATVLYDWPFQKACDHQYRFLPQFDY